MNSLRVASLKANIDSKVSHISLSTKLFIWSVLFEPLIFFHLVPQNLSGIGGSFSRILQFLFLSWMLINLFITSKIRFPNPFSPLFRNFSYFFILSVIAGILGYLFGSYSLNLSAEFLNNAKPSIYDNFIASFISSKFFRPFFEYFIALYYFVYFVVLSQYMIVTKEEINYFFKCFNIVFLICLFVGFIDLLLLLLLYPEYEGIPRYIADGTTVIGFRFHGIIGEPRDAFNYLILCVGVLSLRDIWYQEKKLTFYWYGLILIALNLTYSFSGVLGVIFASMLLVVFYLPSINLKKQLIVLFFLCTILFLIILNIKYSLRMMQYYNAFLDLYQTLNSGGEISPVAVNFMNNIYPLWHLWLEVREFNFFHLFFGNGFGSASVVNNYYINEDAILNPNASIIRMFYENGIIGIFIFIWAFLTPLKILFINVQIYNRLKFLMILMIGMYFAHRSVAIYLFMGISLVVLRYKLLELKSNSSFKNV